MFTWPQRKVRDLVLKFEKFNNDGVKRYPVSKNKIRYSKFYVNLDIYKKIKTFDDKLIMDEEENKKFNSNYKSHSVAMSCVENRKVIHFQKMYSLQLKPDFCINAAIKENFLDIDMNMFVMKNINPIVQELLETEKTYVEALKQGIHKYGGIFQLASDLPAELNGQEYQLLANVFEIYELHEHTVLPMIQSNIGNFSILVEKFLRFFDVNTENQRPITVIYFDFILKMKHSLQLRQTHSAFFQTLQTKLSDPLGINSFLMQPITRPTKYPLLINSLLNAIFKAKHFFLKSDIDICCKLLKKTKELLNCMNNAGEINTIEDLPLISNRNYGPFKLSTNFEIFDILQRRRYNGKVFLFHDMIICTEQSRERLIYRECYPYDHIGIETINGNCFRLFYDKKSNKELEFSNSSTIIINEWIALIGNMLNLFIGEEKLRLFRMYSITSKKDLKMRLQNMKN